MMAANHIRRTSEPVDGAAHAERTTIEHVRIHHRRTDVRVPEQLLHGSNVVPILEQVCCERVPQRILTLLMNRPQPSSTTVTIPFTANL